MRYNRPGECENCRSSLMSRLQKSVAVKNVRAADNQILDKPCSSATCEYSKILEVTLVRYTQKSKEQWNDNHLLKPVSPITKLRWSYKVIQEVSALISSPILNFVWKVSGVSLSYTVSLRPDALCPAVHRLFFASSPSASGRPPVGPFRGPNRWKSEVAEFGLYSGWLSIPNISSRMVSLNWTAVWTRELSCKTRNISDKFPRSLWTAGLSSFCNTLEYLAPVSLIEKHGSGLYLFGSGCCCERTSIAFWIS